MEPFAVRVRAPKRVHTYTAADEIGNKSADGWQMNFWSTLGVGDPPPFLANSWDRDMNVDKNGHA